MHAYIHSFSLDLSFSRIDTVALARYVGSVFIGIINRDPTREGDSRSHGKLSSSLSSSSYHHRGRTRIARFLTGAEILGRSTCDGGSSVLVHRTRLNSRPRHDRAESCGTLATSCRRTCSRHFPLHPSLRSDSHRSRSRSSDENERTCDVSKSARRRRGKIPPPSRPAASRGKSTIATRPAATNFPLRATRALENSLVVSFDLLEFVNLKLVSLSLS